VGKLEIRSLHGTNEGDKNNSRTGKRVNILICFQVFKGNLID